ncbi:MULTISPECIES: hypothetical protein [Xanthomonas]|uniref:Uncharacterized protein n=3 Tax=Xanthomonas TaxID=338 RepID=A0AAJ0N3G5_9XANT|nr:MULTISPECIES: hypothetical protein [Xanthomonas]MEB1846129.1 hypothetical protein [Xanthomonas campestris pv. campestris]APO97719.1 hypothetical protein BJD13_00575 [Xanthomonas perforans]APP78242.1 hypothetical protein BJD12_23230 [Xanthomonas vesicatoria ATCC 35937]APP87255.1 hypothetical protein BI317_24640 [Xanthomonas hortorum pv. gardneri]EGD07974.1 hypothetical protein XVE_3839 [Xanthomonas vesicatoria ATCC 35937]
MLTNEGTHQLAEKSGLFDARTALNTLTRLEHNGLPVLASYDLTTTTLRVTWNVPAQCLIQVPEPMVDETLAALRYLSGIALRRTFAKGISRSTVLVASWQLTDADEDEDDDSEQEISHTQATLHLALPFSSQF